MKLLRRGERYELEYCAPHSPTARLALEAKTKPKAVEEVAAFLGLDALEVAAELGVDLESSPDPRGDAPLIVGSAKADAAWEAYRRGPHNNTPQARPPNVLELLQHARDYDEFRELVRASYPHLAATRVNEILFNALQLQSSLQE